MRQAKKEKVKVSYLGKGRMVKPVIKNVNSVLKKFDFHVEMSRR